MSPEAQRLLDQCLDLLDGQIDPRDWVDIGHAITCAGIARLPEERRASVEANVARCIERDVALMASAEQSKRVLN